MSKTEKMKEVIREASTCMRNGRLQWNVVRKERPDIYKRGEEPNDGWRNYTVPANPFSKTKIS